MSEVAERAILCFVSYFIVIIGSISNLISLSYFIRQTKRSPSTFIFITNNALDLIVCMTLTPVLLSTTAGGAALLFHFQWFCTFWNFFYAFALRMSMFVMAVLCVTRTLSLVKPLYGVRIWHLVVCLVVYLVFLVVSRVVVVERVVYDAGHMFCVAKYNAHFAANCTTILTDVSKILVPIVPSIAGCIITICYLRSSRRIKGAQGATQRHNKHDAIVTVVILTILFLIVTMPHFVLLIFQVICNLSNEKVCVSLPTQFLHHLFCFYVPTLNSACNPLVYLIRIKKLRTYSLQILTCGMKGGDRVKPSEYDSRMLSKVHVKSPLRAATGNVSPYCNMETPAICKINDIQ